MNEKIEEIIRRDFVVGGSTLPQLARYEFVPTAKLIVNDCESNTFVGDLFYNNPLYEFAGAVCTRGWIFALERMTLAGRTMLAPSNDCRFLITAFHGGNHYQFDPNLLRAIRTPDGQVPDATVRELRDALVTYLVTRLWPVLHSDFFDRYLDVSGEQEEDSRGQQQQDKSLGMEWKYEALASKTPNDR